MPEPPGRLLTVDAYVALGEDDRYRTELQEGNLVMSPSPAPDHMIVMGDSSSSWTSSSPRLYR